MLLHYLGKLINQKFCTSLACKTFFKSDFFVQQIPIKYHENNCKNVHHLQRHMPGDAIHFPTGQCTGSPCSWNHRAVAAWDTQFHSVLPSTIYVHNSLDLRGVREWWGSVSTVYQSRVNTADELKEFLIALWSNFWQDLIDTATDQWRKHRHANCGHFKHLLWTHFCKQFAQKQLTHIFTPASAAIARFLTNITL